MNTLPEVDLESLCGKVSSEFLVFKNEQWTDLDFRNYTSDGKNYFFAYEEVTSGNELVKRIIEYHYEKINDGSGRSEEVVDNRYVLIDNVIHKIPVGQARP